MVAPMILKFNPQSEYYFEEGCYIIEQLNSETDPHLSIARARVTPGAQTRWHSLENTIERYQILCGQGLVEVGTEPPVEVNEGDTVIIPAATLAQKI